MSMNIEALLLYKDKSIPFVLYKFLFVSFHCVPVVAIYIYCCAAHEYGNILCTKKSTQMEEQLNVCVECYPDWYNIQHTHTATIQLFHSQSQINLDISIKHHTHIRYSRMPNEMQLGKKTNKHKIQSSINRVAKIEF